MAASRFEEGDPSALDLLGGVARAAANVLEVGRIPSSWTTAQVLRVAAGRLSISTFTAMRTVLEATDAWKFGGKVPDCRAVTAAASRLAEALDAGGEHGGRLS
ncbi:MAG: hypothetical protein ACE5GJ_09825 [Gemmatimonadota bacterium]